MTTALREYVDSGMIVISICNHLAIEVCICKDHDLTGSCPAQ